MNQGNVGAHTGDNGSFHDGGLLLSFPDRIIGVFLAFQTQPVPTDASGAAASGAQPLSRIISTQPHAPAMVAAAVYLERALINPAGSDPGLEAVLGNCATTTHPCTGGSSATATAALQSWMPKFPPALRRSWRSTEAVCQLGNNGGNLVLQNDQANQVDSATYSAADAAVVDRYMRFQR